jgi:hypothetical protein
MQGRLWVAALALVGACKGAEDKPHDDVQTLRFPDGHKAAEGPFRDGSREGQWRTWDESGAVTEEGTYEHGEKTGGWMEVIIDPSSSHAAER